VLDEDSEGRKPRDSDEEITDIVTGLHSTRHDDGDRIGELSKW
jgi:hypothetical protein